MYILSDAVVPNSNSRTEEAEAGRGRRFKPALSTVFETASKASFQIQLLEGL